MLKVASEAAFTKAQRKVHTQLPELLLDVLNVRGGRQLQVRIVIPGVSHLGPQRATAGRETLF